MHDVALATDYDGTIARNGEVDGPTLAALERLRGASRKLILVTGHELDHPIRRLRAVPQELDISSRNVVAAGDAENDFAFLDLCAMPVAVANALPRLMDAALVTQGERGAGVAELVDLRLETDLAGVDETNGRQHVSLADRLDGGEWLALVPVRQSLLLTGTAGTAGAPGTDGSPAFRGGRRGAPYAACQLGLRRDGAAQRLTRQAAAAPHEPDHVPGDGGRRG